MTSAKEVERIEEEWTQALVKEDWNLFVTLTFKKGISPRQILAVYGNFVVYLRQHMHGKKSRKRMDMFPVIEGELPDDKMFLQRRHFHVLRKIQGRVEQTRDLLRRLWITSDIVCGECIAAALAASLLPEHVRSCAARINNFIRPVHLHRYVYGNAGNEERSGLENQESTNLARRIRLVNRENYKNIQALLEEQ